MKKRFIIVSGLPSSGKSTYIKKETNGINRFVVISTDAIRAELCGDPSDQSHNKEVFELAHSRIKEFLNSDCYDTVFFDATNISRKDRRRIFAIIPKGVEKEVHIVWASIETCIARDKNRDRTVGADVIMKMAKRFQIPDFTEDFDKWVFINTEENFNAIEYRKMIFDKMNMWQHNSHHTLKVDDHCIKAAKYCEEKDNDPIIYNALLFHDCGKPYTQTFYNMKGEKTEEAHYYGHQNVGAWIALGAFPEISIEWNFMIAWLVNNHMEPFFNSKFYRSLNEFQKKLLDEVHEADVYAH